MKAIAIFALFVLFYSTQAYVNKLEEYQASLQAWKSIQPKTYTYSTYAQSFLANGDITVRTYVTVTDGVVVRREYSVTESNTVTTSWVEETPQEIGSHDEGFKALTLDQLYSQCRENILVYDNVKFTITFETDANGVMRQCNARVFRLSHPDIMGIDLFTLEY